MKFSVLRCNVEEIACLCGHLSSEESPMEVVCKDFHNDIYKLCTAKVCVFADSVFCLGGNVSTIS